MIIRVDDFGAVPNDAAILKKKYQIYGV